MVKRPALLESLRLAAVLSASVVHGQTDNTVGWTIGMALRLYSTTTETCPTSLEDADKNAADFNLVLASKDATSSAGTEPDLAATVYFTNGLHKLGVPFTEDTQIKVAEPVGPGGGCWDTSDGSTVRVAPCNLQKNQTFYVAIDGTGPFDIFTSTLDAVDRPTSPGQPLTFDAASSARYCAYANSTGKLVVPPTTTPLHYPQTQVTNLTASSFGSALPTSDNAIPECNFAISGGGSMLDSLASTDCIVARTFATLPSGCDANPASTTCILHLWSAFCIDLPEVRNGLNTSDAVDSCVKKVTQGPCVANPAGAACASGLFAGIQYVGGIGGGSGSSASKRQNSNDVLFGTTGPDIPLEDQFWMGVMKNIINQAIGGAKALSTPFVRELQVTCMGMGHVGQLFEESLGKKIRDGCRDAFKTFDDVHELSLDNDIEKAGSVFADVVSLLSLAGDIAQAAKAVGAVDMVMAKFTKAATTIGEGKGLMLEAKEGENTVQIFADSGDGTPKPFYTDSDVSAMQKSIEEEGFDNCKACVEGGGAKLIRRQKGLFRKLCCFLNPRTHEAPENVGDDGTFVNDVVEAVPMAERTIADLSMTNGLTKEETDLVNMMSESFAKWYKEGTPASARVDEISSLLVEAAKNKADLVKIATATRKAYGLTNEETSALRTWCQFYYIWGDFPPALAKMPAVNGMVIRSTDLEASTVSMLDKLEAGTISKGTPGVYEVRDLVINSNSGFTEDHDFVRRVMATTLNLGENMFTTTKDYLFVIDSKSGRFVAGPANSGYSETDFLQDIAGKFKLLGRRDLNGGAAAKAAKRPGPYAVYFFEEIDAPASTSTVTLDTVKKALADEGVSLPGPPAKRELDSHTKRLPARPNRNRARSNLIAA